MKNQALKVLAVFAPAAVVLSEVVAYNSGTNTGTDAVSQMDSLLVEILSWVEGPLGTILAIASITVGLGMGVMNQSVISAVTGVAFAAVVSYGPDIIQGITGSSVEVAL